MTFIKPCFCCRFYSQHTSLYAYVREIIYQIFSISNPCSIKLDEFIPSLTPHYIFTGTKSDEMKPEVL